MLARRGDWEGAAADFEELARLPAFAAAVYPAGWWTLASPEDQPPAFPPPSVAAPARWLARADDPNGFVALPGDGTTVVSRVFAPRRQLAALDVGPVSPGRLWLNGKTLGAADTGPVLVELQEGWNSLAMRGGPGERFVRWRAFDNPADHTERLAFARPGATSRPIQPSCRPCVPGSMTATWPASATRRPWSDSRRRNGWRSPDSGPT